jgi:hypothetical protein
MDRLEDFFDHEDPIVQRAARDLAVLQDGLHNDDLSKEQFDELVNDILEIDEVRRTSETLERKIKIIQAFNAIKLIVGVLAK